MNKQHGGADENLITSYQYRRKVRNGSFKIKKLSFPKFKGDEPCTTRHPDLLYPEIITEKHARDAAVTAREICNGCPMLNECLEWGLFHEFYGIWGGTTSTQRKKLREQLKIAWTDPSLVDKYLSIEKELATA
jgi:hypothetical protein